MIRKNLLCCVYCFLGLIVLFAGAADPQVKTPPGSEAIDESIEKALRYLVDSQNSDGTFPGKYGDTCGVVSLAGMAFLSKGYLPLAGPNSDVIRKCIDYVLKSQRDQGLLDKRGQHAEMYSHTISTLFLSEVSGMVDPERQKLIDRALGLATKVILDAQAVKKDEHNKGGWRYKANSADSDLSCSGWALMALRSARLNGAPVPVEAINKAVEYVMRRRNEQSGEFGYQDRNSHSVTLTGAALLCLELTGRHGKPETYSAGDFILKSLDKLPSQERPFYGNYYNAQGTFQLGGKYWEKYSGWMYEYWMPRQREDGSWVSKDGEIYDTCMMVLAFTVPYRQLPIYQRDETVDDE